MRLSLLNDLRCPYCGGAFNVSPALDPGAATCSHAVLCCACCAYPVVEGIPVLTLGDEVTAAIRAIERGDHDAALGHVLDLPAARHDEFRRLCTDADASFARAVRALLPDGEGDYYVLRFGDPTFVVADTVTRVVAAQLPDAKGRFVDVCGGCGHLTTTLAELAAAAAPTPLLLDRSFWRLWLAGRFLAPSADLACCDANVPLPLASGCASLVACNDAFHYVWSKRLLASEMERIARADGAVVITHVHSALGDNATAGNTLAPGAYASLFDRHRPRLARDAEILQWAIGGPVPRWDPDGAACGDADAVDLISTSHAMSWPERPGGAPVERGWVINPLLSVRPHGDTATLTVEWPSDHYAAEFAEARSYLAESLDLPADGLRDLARLAESRPDLVLRRVLLRVPDRYI